MRGAIRTARHCIVRRSFSSAHGSRRCFGTLCWLACLGTAGCGLPDIPVYTGAYRIVELGAGGAANGQYGESDEHLLTVINYRGFTDHEQKKLVWLKVVVVGRREVSMRIRQRFWEEREEPARHHREVRLGEDGEIVVHVCWDRARDTVSIGGQEFVRLKGRLFVVHMGDDGKIVAIEQRPLSEDDLLEDERLVLK